MTTVTKQGVQNLRGTDAQFTAANVILKAGELAVVTDLGFTIMGDGSSNYATLKAKRLLDANNDAYVQSLDKVYNGVNLTTKFATEIAGYSDVWAWIKARKNANNFNGIHVGDYIPCNLSAGTITDGTTSYAITAKTLNMQIIGIDTYYGYGDQEVGHHIDFKSTNSIGTNIPWNPTDNNNGTANYPNPWLASKIYACLNGVNNVSSGYNNVAHGYNASSGGVLQLLPAALQSQIIEKRLYMPTRYSNAGILTNSPAGAWCNAGKLWLPTEMEVYGCPIHSASTAKGTDGLDFASIGTPVQYPLFAGTAGKRNNKNSSRFYCWLSSVASGSSTHACIVNSDGFANTNGCTITWISAPVCFRI